LSVVQGTSGFVRIRKWAQAMSKSIWERRLEIERQEREERQAALDPVHEKFRPMYEALQTECDVSGHEWRFTTLGVGGQAFFACNYCRKTRVED
jgi:hypothetical protein